METPGTKRGRRPLLLLLALAVAHLALLLVGDLAAEVRWTVAILFVASALLWLGVGWLRRVPLTAVTVITGAVVLRVLLLPLSPTLSDDILRYLWDGEVAAAGSNPYLRAPDDPRFDSLNPQLRERLPHGDVATVYPPVAVGLFALATKLPHPVVSLKALLSLADVLGCCLLLSIADVRGLPRERVLLYAWNPLVTLEVAGMGHVDALGVAAVAGAVLLLVGNPSRSGFAAVAAATGVLTKVVPIVACPAWMRQSARPDLFALAGLGILVIGWIPVVMATGGVPPGYIRFGVSWEFNGPLYEPFWRLLDLMRVPELIEYTLDAVKSATGWHELWSLFYPYNYPQLIARLLLAAASLPLFVRAWRDRDPLRSTGMAFAALLLFSSTVYPWYVLWVLPWAALTRQRSWLLLTALLPLSYLPQFLDLELFPAVFCAIWLPFILVLGMERRWFAS